MRYESYRYLYPPRPEGEGIPRALFHRYDNWWLQIKKQGTLNVMAYRHGEPLIAMNRHRQQHATSFWQPTEATSRVFRQLRGRGWYYFCAELMHKKTAMGERNINFLFDVLVADGEYLVGTTFADRQRMLFDFFHPTTRSITGSHWLIDQNTWLAVNFHDTDFLKVFENLNSPDDEGVVFKRPDARLEPCVRGANTRWQAKSRRSSKTHLE